MGLRFHVERYRDTSMGPPPIITKPSQLAALKMLEASQREHMRRLGMPVIKVDRLENLQLSAPLPNA